MCDRANADCLALLAEILAHQLRDTAPIPESDQLLNQNRETFQQIYIEAAPKFGLDPLTDQVFKVTEVKSWDPMLFLIAFVYTGTFLGSGNTFSEPLRGHCLRMPGSSLAPRCPWPIE
jgi:hypothetical protein